MECFNDPLHGSGGLRFEEATRRQGAQVMRGALKAAHTYVNASIRELVEAVGIAKQALGKPDARDAEATAKGVGGRNEIGNVHRGNDWGIYTPSSTGHCSLFCFCTPRAICWRYGNS